MITRFTFTGADDQTSIKSMEAIQATFPFVEFGILVGSHIGGSPRFPTPKWIESLTKTDQKMNLSLHLCGKYVNNILQGKTSFLVPPSSKGVIQLYDFEKFQRVQINTHGFKHDFNPVNLIKLINDLPRVEFIFQFDNQNSHILNAIKAQCKNISVLFDLSHGAGILPEEWPELLPDIKCGYAGGLRLKNLREEMGKVEKKTGKVETWIDIETHVRNLEDQFDLGMVVQCCNLYSNVKIENRFKDGNNK